MFIGLWMFAGTWVHLFVELHWLGLTPNKDLAKNLCSGLDDKGNLDHSKLQASILKDTNGAIIKYLKQDAGQQRFFKSFKPFGDWNFPIHGGSRQGN